MTTLAASVRSASRALEAAGWDVSSAWLDAEVLARTILEWDLAEWLLRQDQPASEAFRASFDSALTRRLRHEPIAYITGEREFYGRSFRVSQAVLIPRPETELVIEEGLLALAARRSEGVSAPKVMDVGVGSGVLAITLALEAPSARLVATDVSTAALEVAASNVQRFDLSDRVDLRHASLLGDCADGRLDLVVSNPPYVSEQDRPALMPDVRDYEPEVALFGGEDGLEVIRALIPAAARGLRPGGWFVMEMGSGQSDGVTAIVGESAELELIRISDDLAGIRRVVVARRRL